MRGTLGGGDVGGERGRAARPSFARILTRGREHETGRDDALNRGVVCEVHEQRSAGHRAALLKVLREEAGRLHVHAHGAEDDGEVVLVRVHRVLARLLHEARLAHDLGADFIVRQARGGEERDLLPSRDRVHHVNGGDARLNRLLGVHARVGVNGLSHNVQELLREDGGPAVLGPSGPVKRAPQHLFADGHLQHVARELHVCVRVVNAVSALKHLHNRLLARYFEHLAGAALAVAERQRHNLAIPRALHGGNQTVSVRARGEAPRGEVSSRAP